MGTNFDGNTNNEVTTYSFIDLENRPIKSGVAVDEFIIPDLKEHADKARAKQQPQIKIERKHARDNMFTVSPIVEHFRGLKDQESEEQQQIIQRQVEEIVLKYKEEAYREGFEQGRQEGAQKIQEELIGGANEKIDVLENMINGVTEVRETILKKERRTIYEVVRTLTKWVLLKEIKDDEKYIERLLEKLILELQVKANLLIRVGRGNFDRMPEVLEVVEGRIGQLSNVRIEVSEDPQEQGIIVESENGILNGTVDAQLDIINKMFKSLEAYERNES